MNRKWWLIAAALAVIAALIAGSFLLRKEDKPMTNNAATAQVRKGNLTVSVSGTGSIQPAARETLKPGESGTVSKLRFQAGDKVKKGDVLIELSGQDLSNQIRSEEISLQKKQLDLTDLQNKLKSAADDAGRDSAMLSIKKQLLDIESSRKQIESLQSEQQPEPITAPIDGVLVSLDAGVGDEIGPNASVAEVADYDNLQLVVAIDELDIPQVKLGQEAQVTVEALPNRSFAGKVVKIADEGTQSNGVATFDVTVQIIDAADIKAGMSAEASILVQQKNNVLYLPVEAVHVVQNRYFVMVPKTDNSADTPKQSDPGQAASGSASRAGASGNGQFAAGDGSRQFAAGQRGGDNAGAVRRQAAAAGSNSQAIAGAGAIKAVEVGIHNENFIEIVSGLNEGEHVLLPSAAATTSSNQNQMRIPGAGFGGGFGGGPTGEFQRVGPGQTGTTGRSTQGGNSGGGGR